MTKAPSIKISFFVILFVNQKVPYFYLRPETGTPEGATVRIGYPFLQHDEVQDVVVQQYRVLFAIAGQNVLTIRRGKQGKRRVRPEQAKRYASCLELQMFRPEAGNVIRRYFRLRDDGSFDVRRRADVRGREVQGR